jgi:hypothetical protein
VRRTWILALAASLSSCGRTAAGPLEVEPNPVDFGEVVSPDQILKVVTARNRSDRPLFLEQPRFDCSCFALTSPPPSVLGPGESMRLEIVMDSTKTDPKRFSKSLTFVTDDPEHPVVAVPVVGEVLEYRRWSAVRLDLGESRSDARPTARRRASVRPGEGFRVTAKDVASSDPRLRATVEPTTEGSDLVVEVVPGAGAGAVQAQVQVTLVVEGRGRPARTVRDSLWVTGTIK